LSSYSSLCLPLRLLQESWDVSTKTRYQVKLVLSINQVYSRLRLHVGNIFAFFRRKCVVLNDSFDQRFTLEFSSNFAEM